MNISKDENARLSVVLQKVILVKPDKDKPEEFMSVLLPSRMYVDDIRQVERICNDQGYIYSDFCKIYNELSGEAIVKCKFNELSPIVFGNKNNRPVVGFTKNK